ncbi:MAG: protein kinase [Kofleriaceae bacterium]|nr:protein kinase [Kofleriaceae bacterium]
MKPGEVVESRFELERIAGSGGMGTVYRAIDRTSGSPVAFKVLRSASVDAAQRFAREVRILAGLRHPGIVRYIADGRTPDGEMWLAMEWLEGESLNQRLARGELTAAEAVDLVRRIAEALGAAHERGVIHRDLKPSNLFLADFDLERVKVLDFGVARVADASATRTGVMVGTPGYMAPEQARGDRNVGARSDVFALGCLLFECLTGKPPFVGENVMAVLAKILLEDAPRVGAERGDIPEALDDLVARTLSKSPDQRPRDGAHLAAELASIGTIGVGDRAAGTPSAALTSTERRLLCVVLIDVGKSEPIDMEATRESVPSLDDTFPSDTGGSQPRDTVAESHRPELKSLREAAEAHGARLQRLVDGSLVVTLLGTGGTSDQAMQAARCALALKAHLQPATPMALATGRGVMAGRWPVGEAIDRAATLLAAARNASPHLVRVDEVTAGLLDTRFDVGGDDAGLFLLGERDLVQATRTLLGKPTPCVGRDRELGVLHGLFEEALAEPMARAVLVTGAAGVGKSRVRYELVRWIKARDGEPVEIWIGRGDQLRTGSPFGMIAPALRHAAGILDGEPIEVRRQKLRARVMRHAGTDLARTTLFLGELVGVPFPDDESVELRAARQDTQLMADQVRFAFEHFLAVETSAQPVVIVLEDLHWGDLPTTKLIDSALRALPDRPWFVVALARPEIHELFPRLWAERGVQELRLDELTKRGSEKLVRQVLGARANDMLVAKLVEQAGGNAFYLEELIRSVAEGKGDAIPETVLAVVQGRLERLEVDARRVLRAASVFGHQFWRGGVTKLLGGDARDSTVRSWLDELVERELVQRAPKTRFTGEDEYQFRHAMVREAAYAMLTDADRKLGHRLAGEWLHYAGETEAMVLAEHFERGGEPARAAVWYKPAVDQALAAGDFRGAANRAERGVACGATGETLGGLRRAQAEAHKWCGEFAVAERCAIEAMTLLLAGSAAWFSAAGEAAEASGKLGDVAQLSRIADLLVGAPDLDGERAARVSALAHAAFQLYNNGRYQLAESLVDAIDRIADEVSDPRILARIYQTRSSRAMFAGDSGAYVVSEVAAAQAFEAAGDLRYTCMQHGHVGYAYLEIGAYTESERWLRKALDGGMRMGLQNVVATAKHNLGRALQYQGRLDEAFAIESEAIAAFAAQGDRRLESASRSYLADILAARGDLDASERELRLGLQTVQAASRPRALAALGQLLLLQRRAGEALIAAREAHDLLDTLGGVEEGESLVRLTYALALDATGDREAACTAIRRARERVLERAAKITDPEWRASFLENLPENAKTLAFARDLLDT